MDEGKIIFDGDVEKAIELYTAVTPQKLPGKYIYDKTYHKYSLNLPCVVRQLPLR